MWLGSAVSVMSGMSINWSGSIVKNVAQLMVGELFQNWVTICAYPATE